MERTISRKELYSEQSSPSAPESDNEDITKILSTTQNSEIQLEEIPPFAISVRAAEDKLQEIADAPDAIDDGLDFRLFATPSAPSANINLQPDEKTAGMQKIRLRSPTPETTNGGFVKPSRDLSYYFTSPSASQKPTDFVTTALSGAEILTLSKIPWPGTSLQWKVLQLPATGEHRSIRSNEVAAKGFLRLTGEATEKSKRHCRPGKKYRLRIRKRKVREAAKREVVESKELAEREKRNRRNREKKIKRRAREREKKAAQAGGGDSNAAVAGGEEGDGSDGSAD